MEAIAEVVAETGVQKGKRADGHWIQQCWMTVARQNTITQLITGIRRDIPGGQ